MQYVMSVLCMTLQTMPIGILQQTNKVIAYEFFSGIGGFHAALKTSCNGRVKKAFEISPKCIKVYGIGGVGVSVCCSLVAQHALVQSGTP